MKLVPFATSVRMDVKSFPSRRNVPLLITHSIVHHTHFAHYRNGLHHQHRALSYSCVSLGWLNGVTQYWSRNLCGFAYHRNMI
ncbi:hypothetical protein T08_437 [Trichinella sp. T8]|nr:hypothetical protein T08_437 [Trichinella sp. T8]